MLRVVIKYVVLILCLTSFVNSHLEDCLLEDFLPGVCVALRDCDYARKVLNDNNKLPQTCRFDDTGHPIVCCPKDEAHDRYHIIPETSAEMKNGIDKPKKLSTMKCEEYASKLKNVLIKDVNFNIINGENATKGEYPHMAALGYGEADDIQWKCGGSLISEKFVLTAAHCLESETVGLVTYVKLGDIFLDGTNAINYQVEERFPHPNYLKPSKYDDIALLKLDTIVNFNLFIKPACLFTEPNFNLVKKYTFDITGWGLLSHGGDSSNILQKASLEILDDCKDHYKESPRLLAKGIISETQVCAGSKKQIDTCQGDSGGPLQIYYYEKKLHCVVGITSFGKICGAVDNAGIYTRVSYYIPWIEKIVWSAK